jgi:hypothetical protein
MLGGADRGDLGHDEEELNASPILYQHHAHTDNRATPPHRTTPPPTDSSSHHEPHHALSVRPPAEHNRPQRRRLGHLSSGDSRAGWTTASSAAPWVEQSCIHKRTDMLDMRVIFVGHLAGNILVVHEERMASACLLSACV